MEGKTAIKYGETAIDVLLQWLRAQDRPQDLEALTRRYLELLKELSAEAQQ